MSVFQGTTSSGAGTISGGSGGIEEINHDIEEMSLEERRAYLTTRLGSAEAADAYLRATTADGDGPAVEGEQIAELDQKSNVVGCNEFTNDTPVSTRVSRYYTLAMMSSQTVYTRYNIVPNVGLSKAQIMCNLKHLAVNSLDPIRAWHTKVKIGSGFRSNSTTDHGRGSAADLYFYKAGTNTRMSVPELTGVAKYIMYTLKVPFTKLLLESSGNGTGWIHIANRKDGVMTGQRVAFSLNNGKTFTPGLPRV